MPFEGIGRWDHFFQDKKDKDRDLDKGIEVDAFGAMDFGLSLFEPEPVAAPDAWGMEAPQFDDPFRTTEVPDVSGFPETCHWEDLL